MVDKKAVTRELWLKCLYQPDGIQDALWVTKVFKVPIQQITIDIANYTDDSQEIKAETITLGRN